MRSLEHLQECMRDAPNYRVDDLLEKVVDVLDDVVRRLEEIEEQLKWKQPRELLIGGGGGGTGPH
tara:strand:- start:46 stop:240 length:195 start_codon:yes stop_codon:yes gene_type:complete